MIHHGEVAVRWLKLAEEIQQLADELPVNEGRSAVDRLVAQLRMGASRENALALNSIAVEADSHDGVIDRSLRRSA